MLFQSLAPFVQTTPLGRSNRAVVREAVTMRSNRLKAIIVGLWLALGAMTGRVSAEDFSATEQKSPKVVAEEEAKRMEALHIRMMEKAHRGHAHQAQRACLIGLGILLAITVAGMFAFRRWRSRVVLLAGLAVAGLAWCGYVSALTF